ncbi:MAG TPA: type II toxin-antitoxin system VapC family toxin [Thermoanaerobaculia bacterium]|nr:type II toxin-antitoxin system VapC family toxin [Thermoanaerobaculia bacterium]
MRTAAHRRRSPTLSTGRFCLDTSAYSYFKRGHPPVVALIDQAAWIGVPSIVIGELWVGFLLGQRPDRNQEDLAEFLRQPVVEELPVDGEIGQIYAEMVVALRKSGTPVPSNDIWVAATSARAGATVLTYDSHFAAIKRASALVLQST